MQLLDTPCLVDRYFVLDALRSSSEPVDNDDDDGDDDGGDDDGDDDDDDDDDDDEW